MNFFAQQARARRRTSLLTVYFVAAVLATALAVNLVLYLGLFWLTDGTYPLGEWLLSPGAIWAALLTLGIILGGSLIKFWRLRGGGPALADMLGARRIDPASKDVHERRLINVVEEMAIASGIPVPQLFVLGEETTINAFAAGFRPTESTIMVTQGALEQLNRDELQGVIAHEFSHIFNADMRLNLRLMAVLAGILAVGKVGELMLRSTHRRGVMVRTNNSRNAAGGIAAAIGLGMALVAIGYIGLFFGRLIKAAISRQRELLADASSVQFTRNPAGIAGALIKIRNGQGSLLTSTQAEDMSHMCFADTVSFNMRRLLATHPEMDERLSAIGPEWVARARNRARQQLASDTAAATQPGATEGLAAASGAALFGGATALAGTALHAGRAPQSQHGASQQVGTVTPAHMGYASRILESVPLGLRDQLHDRPGAEQLMYALAISVSQSTPEDLLPALDLTPQARDAVAALVPVVQSLGTRLRLPLIDLAIPTLKQGDQATRDAMLQRLTTLIHADRRMTLFEFVLLHLLRDHLGAKAGRNQPVRHRSYRAVAPAMQVLLSMMIYVGGQRGEAAQALFRRITGVLLPPGTPLLAIEACTLDRLTPALTELAGLTPLLKAGLVDACADAVLADNRVQVAEAELLRAVCTLLDCPMPPLFTPAPEA
ncbi:M48 family metallopeptidase [Alcanivorax sp. JB21]|uniref:M48 family metallopeptidase n=1 Tax=Alcanivorax limicola TaxID=2874102 RepID=UPI001CBECE1A|nr:M48 family metallopeptidase [Alcanivorax limicola]MBZ2188614.1 M48 family metallopeptidase [Alcanivorax limicola]